MHTGLSVAFQNLDSHISDAELYRYHLAMAREAEQEGWDSVWCPEHHFSEYVVSPATLQFLSWLAGQTTTIRLGTMVTVLPWHDPVRVVESFTVLDHLSNGRSILGIGRGLGRIEFDGFRLNMGESRQRFSEYTEAVLLGLETGVMEYSGELYLQPRVEIRPSPLKSFKGRVFAAAVSPQSFDLMACLGVGLMVIPQKPWDVAQAELAAYRKQYIQLNNNEPSKPVLQVMVCSSSSADIAEDMRQTYVQRYCRSVMEHYEFANAAFAEIEGYEYYAALSKNIAEHGPDRFCSFLADLQVWGTPDRATERILDYVDKTNAGAVLVCTSFGGMSTDAAAANHELITKEVLPALQAYNVGGDIGSPYEATVTAPKQPAASR